MFLPNGTIQQYRAGAALGAPKRVQVIYPSRKEQMAADGGVVATHMRDDAHADWLTLDKVTILSLDGTALPLVVNYSVNIVTRMPGFLPATDLELAGGVQ